MRGYDAPVAPNQRLQGYGLWCTEGAIGAAPSACGSPVQGLAAGQSPIQQRGKLGWSHRTVQPKAGCTGTPPGARAVVAGVVVVSRFVVIGGGVAVADIGQAQHVNAP
jgi:hypothetical protein